MLKTYLWSLLATLFIIITGCASNMSSLKIKQEAKAFQLDNGLNVILQSDTSLPLTAFYMRVNTGSIHEISNYGSGLSHFFEHSLFLGSEKFPGKDEYSSTIESYGGANVNAYTTFDHTAYHFSVLSQYNQKALEAMQDFIFNPLFPEQEVKNEMGSILSEMDMRDDQIDSYFFKHASRFAFENAAYKWPIIGLKSLFKDLSTEELLQYYKDTYTPNNMTLSIVGDFKLNEMAESIKKLYSDTSSKTLEKPVFPKEGAWTNARYEFTHPKAQSSRFAIMHQTVPLNHPDMYPLDVLSHILASGRGSILHETLKEEQKIVQDIHSSSWTPTHGGIFSLNLTFPIHQDSKSLKSDIDRVSKEYLQSLKNIQEGNLDKKQLETVKREVLSSTIRSQENFLGRARSLASSLSINGDLNYNQQYLDGISSVNIKDIQRVIEKYLLGQASKDIVLKQNNIASEMLWSNSVFLKDENISPQQFSVKKQERLQTEHSGKSITASDRASEKTQNDEEEITLNNGLKLIIYHDDKLPMANIVIAANGGVQFENKPSNAIAPGSFNLLVNTMISGNAQYDKAELARELRRHAINLQAFSGKSSFGFRLNTLSDTHSEAADLLNTILQNPLTNEADFQTEIEDQLFQIKLNQEEGWRKSAQLFRPIFFKGSPFIHGAEGTKESLENLKLSDLQTVKENYLTAENTVVGLYGQFSKKEIATYVKYLEKLPQGQNHQQPEIKIQQHNSEKINIDTSTGFRQSYFRMAYYVPALSDTQSASVKVLNAALSGMGGPLFKLRAEEYKDLGGRAYQLGSFYDPSLHYGALTFYAGLRYEARNEYPWAIQSIQSILEEIYTEGLSEKELKRAKSRLLGQEVMSEQSLARKAQDEVLMELYQIGREYSRSSVERIQKVEYKDIKDLMERYLIGKEPVIHVLTPRNEL